MATLQTGKTDVDIGALGREAHTCYLNGKGEFEVYKGKAGGEDKLRKVLESSEGFLVRSIR